MYEVKFISFGILKKKQQQQKKHFGTLTKSLLSLLNQMHNFLLKKKKIYIYAPKLLNCSVHLLKDICQLISNT